jgi:hypothetical protein
MPTREEMRSLAEEIVGSYAERIATVAELRKTVKLDLLESRRHIEELRDSRITTGKQMRADLVKDAANRKHEVGSMLNAFNAELKELNSAHAAMSRNLKADLAKGVANRKHEVGVMLDGFGQALATMGKEMRSDLAKGVADRKREVSIMKGDVGALLRGFSAELKNTRSELAGGRDEWQILTATMQAQRAGPAVEVGPAKAVAAPVEEMTPETTDLGGRLFEYLANHPDGTKMAELEQEFGVARIQMAKVVRSLMDENKVEKRELYYFAI